MVLYYMGCILWLCFCGAEEPGTARLSGIDGFHSRFGLLVGNCAIWLVEEVVVEFHSYLGFFLLVLRIHPKKRTTLRVVALMV
jgi:hypothetical protein